MPLVSSPLPRSPRSAALRAAQILALSLALMIVAAVAPTGASAAGIQIASDGDNPGIAVDAAGTGHIAFASAVETAPSTYTYDYSYCRLPRGATACAPRTRLTTPGNEHPFGGARVLVDATRVIVVGNICCGATEGVWAWTSTNGGASFGAPKQLSTDMWVADAILGPGENSVSFVDYVHTGGIQWATGSLASGSPVVNPINLGGGVDGGKDVDSDARLGLINETTPFMVMYSGSKVWLRRFDATKSNVNSAASWLPAQLIDEAGDDPGATHGPSGAFIGYETETYDQGGYPYAVRRLGDDGSVGPIMKLGAVGSSPNDVDLSQDTSGRVFVAYQDNHADNRLMYQWSKRGVTWSDPIPLSDIGENAGLNTQIGVAPDGGGWVVADDANTRTPVKVWPFGPKGDEDPAPSPPAGSGPTPEPPPACPAQIAVSSIVKAMVRSGDCFKDLGKGRYATTGSVRVNGIDFTAPASGTFTVDTKAHTVAAKGAYKVQAGSLVLQQGSRTWDVTQVQQIDDLSAFGVKLFGLGVKGKADVAFTAAGADLGINVELPSPIDGVRGRTVLRTTMTSGLKVGDVHITADTVPLGPLELRNLDIAYTGANDGLEGHADIYLPPAAGKAITMGFGIEGGTFKHAEFEVAPPTPPLPLPLWTAPPVELTRVGLAAKNDEKGFTLAGGVEIVAGKSISGLRPVAIDALPSSGGGASLFIPKKGNDAVISAKGKIVILDIPVATGSLSLSTAGPLTFSGAADVDFEIVAVKVAIEGGINLSNADFYAGGKGGACVSLSVVSGCAKVSAILSSIGFAVCGSLEGKENLTGASVSIGLGYDRKWGGSGHLGDCAYDQYKPASLAGSGARAQRLAEGGEAALLQAGAGQTIVLPGGSGRGVRIRGAGSRPGFTFAGPGGRAISVPAGLTEPVVGGDVVAVPAGPDEVELQVKRPGGTWTLTPADGSVVANVMTAAELPTPKLSGSVRRAGGRARELTVRAGNLGGQRLIVREVLPGGGAHELGTVRRSGATKLRFTPTDGAGGKRTIEAVIVAGDRQVGTAPITSYTAPGPAKLPAPRKVTLKRAKTLLTVRWTKVSGAARYRVLVTSTDGRKQILTAAKSASRLKVPEVTSDDKVTIRVSAVSRVGAEGKGRTATSKATKKPAKKKTSKKR